jgi:diguanylate cyclase (GGDEF)-like protein/PAS domain S-box-containing protein
MNKKYDLDRNIFLEALFNNSLDAIARMDSEYRIVDINKAFADLFSYNLKEIRGLPLDDVMDKGKSHSSDRSMTEKVINGENIHQEGIRYTKSGQPLHVLIKGIPIIVDKKIIGAYGIYSDITAQKENEHKIQAQKWRLQSIIEGSHVGTWEFNLQTGEAVYNQTWAAIVGYTLTELEEIKNRVFDSLAHPDDLKKSYKLIEKHIAGDLPFYDMECRMKHKKGHWIWVHDRGKIMTYTPEGKPLLMVGTHSDITERKINEEKILYVSHHDNLTGLYNRNYLDEEAGRIESEKIFPVSVIMADLNGLKLVNDTYGHGHGDEMLKEAARILKNNCRHKDIIARWGGDEFVILLPGTSADDAWLVCKRISSSFSEVAVEEIPMTIALGVACRENDTEKLIETIRNAENNMYKQKLTESRSTKNTVLKAFLKTLEAKSFETETHTRRMQDIAHRMGEEIGLPDAEMNRLHLLITLHDIGKINVSEKILSSRNPLNDDEWKEIKKHPEIGFRIARATEEFAHVADDILAHHERWDGNGYPRGLKGTEIPLLARITAIADAFEVMANGRPYKKAMGSTEVAAEFLRCAGSQFDPGLVKILFKLEPFTTIDTNHRYS